MYLFGFFIVFLRSSKYFTISRPQFIFLENRKKPWIGRIRAKNTREELKEENSTRALARAEAVRFSLSGSSCSTPKILTRGNPAALFFPREKIPPYKGRYIVSSTVRKIRARTL